MKTTFHHLAAILLSLAISHRTAAAPQPEGFEGVITKLDPQFVTIKNQGSTERFNIHKAGVCGWPTKKRIGEVFKIGDRVIAYHFGAGRINQPVSALNLFYSDPEKVRAFQEKEQAQTKPSRKR